MLRDQNVLESTAKIIKGTGSLQILMRMLYNMCGTGIIIYSHVLNQHFPSMLNPSIQAVTFKFFIELNLQLSRLT